MKVNAKDENETRQKYQIQSLAQTLRSFSVIASIGVVCRLIVVICVVQYEVIDTA